MLTLPLAQIATLGTEVATHGALRIAEIAGDDVFESMIAVAILIYENYPR
ncbi:hypothetical protein M9978_14365 [Sphingomonas sp. MG17]|uniref:Uncharacterized protein n=1 Tax=Sphingomonas tagetis TaxID=2949092 RepID=A0A9X2KQB2_9SPHN|nr:hypothetical protein [Sphingomonas tagetis]MCP3731608.1 hypothetical protein [Sphingomonas tagetis]